MYINGFRTVDHEVLRVGVVAAAVIMVLRKTAFLSNLYIKTIILPRQARDKHRENSNKRCRFSHQRPGARVATRSEGQQVLLLSASI